jgi:hypothetical protein
MVCDNGAKQTGPLVRQGGPNNKATSHNYRFG